MHGHHGGFNAGLPWQAPTSCPSTPQNRQTNPIYVELVNQAGYPCLMKD
ncbi:MAG: hypothetical protein SH821_11075 [Phototrophicales bacterium]|nr:hypothetical protein [Phototrophicales bacterium]